MASVCHLSNLPEIPDRLHQPGPEFKFPKHSFGKKNVVALCQQLMLHLKDFSVLFVGWKTIYEVL